MLTPVPQQDAGHLDQPQVVRCPLLVAHQDRPALRKPAQRALHYLPPRRVALLAGFVELLLADASDVGNVVSSFHELPRRPVVLAFVQTQVLGRLFGRLGTLKH